MMARSERKVPTLWRVCVPAALAFLAGVGLASALPVTPEQLDKSPDAKALSDTQSSAAPVPSITVKGRRGAEAFADLEARLRARDWDGLIQRARKLLDDEPKSGLAYEIIGTCQFMLRRWSDARAAFERATEVESGQNGPYTKLGILLMEQGELVQGEASLLKAVAIEPGDRFAHQRLGMLYEYQKKTGPAIKHFLKGLEGTDPSYLGVAVNLARLLNQVGRYRDSIAVLEQRLPLQAMLREGHLILAAGYLATGRIQDAERRFQRVDALQPGSKEAQLGFAMVRRRSGDATGALEAIDALLAATPDLAAAHVERGEVLLALGKPDDARAAFDRGVALGASRLYVGKRVAEYHLAQSRFVEAEAAYRDLVKNGVASPDVFARLSELLLTKGDTAAGETVLRNGLERFANNGYLHFRLGSYLASLRRYTDALAELEVAATLSPSDPRVLRTYSLVQSRSGNTRAAADTARRLFELSGKGGKEAFFYAVQLRADAQVEAAEKMYRYVMKIAPDDALALNNLADILADRGALGEAEGLSRRANGIAPDNGRLLDTLGWILLRKGELDTAVTTLRRAAELEPKSAVIQYHMGMALARTGQGTEARAALERALAAGQDADWADEARAALARL